MTVCTAQFFRLPRTGIALTLALSLLLGCGGSDDVALDPHKNIYEALDAATGPLEDLNIKQRDIPELLQKAKADPYARPKKASCKSVREELAELDALLGEDIKPKEIKTTSVDEEIAGLQNTELPKQADITDGAVNMVRDKALSAIRLQTNIIPFRSMVRSITGANKHQKKVAEAYEAGKLRRAYLKGFAAERFGKNCLTRQMPEKKTKEAPKIEPTIEQPLAPKAPSPADPDFDPNAEIVQTDS